MSCFWDTLIKNIKKEDLTNILNITTTKPLDFCNGLKGMNCKTKNVFWNGSRITEKQYEENIPTQYMIGFTLERIKNLTLSTQLNLIPIILDEFTNKEKLYKKIHFGAEYKLIHNDIPILIRMGLRESNNDINYSLGFGLPVKISKKITLNCDYALDPGLVNEGISQLFSITLVNY